MSSIPMAGSGDLTEIPVLGCTLDKHSPPAADGPKAAEREKPAASADGNVSDPERIFHRTRDVRIQQGLSVRTMARRLGIDLRSYRRLEDPGYDLTLSQLQAIQRALDVPIQDLLFDQHTLSRPVEERAKLVRVMKTAVALRESGAPTRVQRMCTMLCEQLVDLMPELATVGGWPQFGARRGQSALGKVLSQPIDMRQMGLSE